MKAARLKREPALAAEWVDVREDERRRLARDLHDGPAQSMAAALFGVDLAVAALNDSPEAARGELQNARALLRDALDDLRGMMTGLRPRILEERGLVAALQSLSGTTPLWGPSLTVESNGFEPGERLAPDMELALYRIAQEAVSNARRHGGAEQVHLSIERTAGSVTLNVRDDGHGFLPHRIGPPSLAGHGLPGMRERAKALGGELTIESSPGKGTLVAVTVPIAA
jgi:signal transduction histidine kinase